MCKDLQGVLLNKTDLGESTCGAAIHAGMTSTSAEP